MSENSYGMPSSRILNNVFCIVCGDQSTGKYYGINTCDGCSNFFKRTIRSSRKYVCSSERKKGNCMMDIKQRNKCRACRLHMCIEAGMNTYSVQYDRGPRNATTMMGNAEMPQIPHELMMNSAALTGFPGLPMPLPLPPGSQHTPLGSGFLPPMVLDLAASKGHQHAFNMHPGQHQALFAPNPAFMNAHILKEIAAEYIFKNVIWIIGVRAFTELQIQDQLQLLEESWKEFFILAMAQYLMPINFTQLLLVYEAEQPNRDIVEMVTRGVHTFNDVLTKLCHLNIDSNEYECLRAISLFRTSSTDEAGNTPVTTGGGSPNSSVSMDTRALIESSKIYTLLDDSRRMLHLHTILTYPKQPQRFRKMLGCFTLMGNISSYVIEELFFRKNIGDVPIVRIIWDMYTQRRI